MERPYCIYCRGRGRAWQIIEGAWKCDNCFQFLCIEEITTLIEPVLPLTDPNGDSDEIVREPDDRPAGGGQRTLST